LPRIGCLLSHGEGAALPSDAADGGQKPGHSVALCCWRDVLRRVSGCVHSGESGRHANGGKTHLGEAAIVRTDACLYEGDPQLPARVIEKGDERFGSRTQFEQQLTAPGSNAIEIEQRRRESLRREVVGIGM
jgi:hypothetical protein